MNQVVRGVGMVTATSSFLAIYYDEVTVITDAESRVVPEHELVERFPLAFAAADPADFATRQAHTELICRHLEREGT